MAPGSRPGGNRGSGLGIWIQKIGLLFLKYILDLPPPRIPVANEGLGWDSLLKMVHNPGGDCYWVGGRPKVYFF